MDRAGTVVPLTASKDIQHHARVGALVVKGCPHAPGDALTIKRARRSPSRWTSSIGVVPLARAGSTMGRPSSFDVTRSDNTSHLSFGLRHSCIGAFLAKENAKRAIEGILRRFPDLELAGDPIPQEMELFSGLASLPVRSRAIIPGVRNPG